MAAMNILQASRPVTVTMISRPFVSRPPSTKTSTTKTIEMGVGSLSLFRESCTGNSLDARRAYGVWPAVIPGGSWRSLAAGSVRGLRAGSWPGALAEGGLVINPHVMTGRRVIPAGIRAQEERNHHDEVEYLQ